MFLTEKTEDNGQLERVSGINSFWKVVQNDLICYTACLGTLSGYYNDISQRVTCEVKIYILTFIMYVINFDFD